MPTSEGAHLVMRMGLEPKGLLRLASRLLRKRLTSMFPRDVENIKSRLEATKPGAPGEAAGR